MTTKLVMPKSGMGVTEAMIAKWYKAEGDSITQGEVIVDIETAKATEEVEAPVSGTLSKILVAEEETVDVHTEIAVIEEFTP